MGLLLKLKAAPPEGFTTRTLRMPRGFGLDPLPKKQADPVSKRQRHLAARKAALEERRIQGGWESPAEEV